MTLKTARSLLSVKAIVALAPLALIANPAQAQPGWVLSHQKISSTLGGGPLLRNGDKFSRVASLGDLDGDGVTEVLHSTRSVGQFAKRTPVR